MLIIMVMLDIYMQLDVGKGESLAQAVNAIAEMKTCNNTVFLECRKRTDLYMWVGKTPHGPCAKVSHSD